MYDYDYCNGYCGSDCYDSWCYGHRSNRTNCAVIILDLKMILNEQRLSPNKGSFFLFLRENYIHLYRKIRKDVITMKKATKNKFETLRKVIRTIFDTLSDMIMCMLGTCIFIIEGVLIVPISSITDSICRREAYFHVLKGHYVVYLSKINIVIDRTIKEMK